EPAGRMRRYHIRDTIVFFGSARSVSSEVAAARLDALRQRAAEAGAETPEFEAEQSRAEYAVKLARYYDDAVELARRVTEWSKGLTSNHHFIICSGGSGGMMEAANRGASLARGKTIGLNIELPFEQTVNPYVSRDLIFNFHYFFMRKFWFVYPAKALVVFPGGFGTMDEMFEVLTLIQTKKPGKTMPVILFGKAFWEEVINFDALIRWGVVSPQDLDIFHLTDSVNDAFAYLTSRLEELYLTPKGLEEVKLT
ncbi:MAG TPA: LOG family protein, partial [Blastocatellia bacterium]|nr:LOG family protein [Blastocatellia bacterium]